MSAQALQRVIVRLLHDPDLTRATRGAALTPTERGWLAQVDPRRWRADPMRRFRMLRALIEEYPVTAALFVRAQGVAGLNAFFESSAFHRSVQSRGVLAIDFGAWLCVQRQADPLHHIAGYAQLEHAIARVRRAPAVRHPVDQSARWQRAPWIAIGRGPLTDWQRLRAGLHAHPEGATAAILDLAVAVVAEAGPAEAWLVDGTGAPQVEALPEALYRALAELQRPQTWSECRAALIREGAEREDADDLLRGLIDDVLLTVCAD